MRLFTKASAVQDAVQGIRANSVHPGAIDIAMGEQVWPDLESRTTVIAQTPVGRIGTPEDIAHGVSLLASGESSFVTGSELVIDGGMAAQ